MITMGKRSSEGLTAAASGSPSVGENTPTGEVKRAGLLIVSDRGGENQYPSLAAAYAAAHDGDEIELRFDGPRVERPLKLSNAG